MTEALLAAGKHTVTAITRHDSKTELPKGVEVKKIDYERQETLVSALRDQEVLIITLSGGAQLEKAQKQLIDAAVEAGVRWVLPNEWGFDTANESLVKDIFISQTMVNIRDYLKQQSKLSFTSVVTGFWYEWSLAIGAAYGIDTLNRTATLFDDGTAKISTSTWPQVGRAVAALLALPVNSDDSKEPCLNDFKNQVVYISSFLVSQRDMLESVYRVTGTKESDWAISSEPARDRYADGLEAMKTGDRVGFAKMMYTRIFYDDKVGDCEHKTINARLGLPKEDLDDATKRAVKRAEETKGGWGAGH
jgi:hypothetical protein